MSARITLSLGDYLSREKAGERACFSCGRVSIPHPPSCNDLHGIELRCGICSEESALPLDAAVREGWLAVVDDNGCSQNDRQAEVR